MVVSAVKLTVPRITQEMGSWECLRRDDLIMSIEVERLTHRGQHHSLVGMVDCKNGVAACIQPCFLTMNMR